MSTNVIFLPTGDLTEFNRGTVGGSAPSAPSGFAASPGDQEISLSWNAVSNILRYHIYYSESSGVTTSDPKIQIDSNEVSYTLDSLINGTTYYFKIAAVGSAGISSLSSEISATPSSYTDTTSVLIDGVDERFTFTVADIEQITISLWLKIDSGVTGFPRLIDMQAYRFVYDPGNQRVQFRANWSNLPIWTTGSSSLLKNNSWYHLLVSYDGSATGNQAVIYIDGVDQSVSASPSPSGTRVSNAGGGSLGASRTPSNYFKGNLNEVAIWSAALDASAVAAVYNSGFPPNLAALGSSGDLAHWWREEFGNTSTIPDQVGGSNLSCVNIESGDFVSDVP